MKIPRRILTALAGICEEWLDERPSRRLPIDGVRLERDETPGHGVAVATDGARMLAVSFVDGEPRDEGADDDRFEAVLPRQAIEAMFGDPLNQNHRESLVMMTRAAGEGRVYVSYEVGCGGEWLGKAETLATIAMPAGKYPDWRERLAAPEVAGGDYVSIQVDPRKLGELLLAIAAAVEWGERIPRIQLRVPRDPQKAIWIRDRIGSIHLAAAMMPLSPVEPNS